jgi:hypothetical protein
MRAIPKKGHAHSPPTEPFELVRIQLRGDRREMLVEILASNNSMAVE